MTLKYIKTLHRVLNPVMWGLTASTAIVWAALVGSLNRSLSLELGGRTTSGAYFLSNAVLHATPVLSLCGMGGGWGNGKIRGWGNS